MGATKASAFAICARRTGRCTASDEIDLEWWRRHFCSQNREPGRRKAEGVIEVINHYCGRGGDRRIGKALAQTLRHRQVPVPKMVVGEASGVDPEFEKALHHLRSPANFTE